LVILSDFIIAQPNLIRNFNFESYTSCPLITNNEGCAIDSNKNVSNWFNFGGITPGSYFNNCANPFPYVTSLGIFKSGIPLNNMGFQNAKSGNGCVGLTVTLSYIRNDLITDVPGLHNSYLGIKLKNNCIKRLTYYGEFNVSASGLDNYLNSTKSIQTNFDKYRNYTTSNMGMLLISYIPRLKEGRRLELPAQINNDTNRNLNDTVNWMDINGTFEANGTEQYLFIGNFADSANTHLFNSYDYPQAWLTKWIIYCDYFIDDVSLIPQNTTHYYDTLLCSNKALELGAVAQADSFEWNDGNKTDKIRSFTSAGLVWVKSWLYGGTVYMWDSLNIISNNIKSGLPKDTFMCNGQTQLTLSSTNANVGATYVWNDGSTGKGLLVNNVNWVNGKYKVWLTTTANYCTQTDTVTIYQKPALRIPINDTTTCFEDVPQILLDAGATFKSYLWLPTGEKSKTVYSYQAQVYKLTVTDSFNCSTSKNIIVDELCKAEIFLPNAFTPNGDSINDVFKPILKTKNLLRYELKVYDSWGNEVFTTTDMNQAWDAKNNLQGVYVVTVNYEYKGFGPNVAKGTVTVMR
jgi:gliding motility-associated-like protein